MSLDSTPATTPKSGSNLVFGFNVPAASGSSSSAGAPAVPDFTFAKPDAVKTSPSTAALDPGTGVFNLGATPKPKAAAKPAPAIDGTGSRKARAAPTKTRGKRGRDDDEDADRSTPSADGAAVNLGSAQPPPDASSEQQAPVDSKTDGPEKKQRVLPAKDTPSAPESSASQFSLKAAEPAAPKSSGFGGFSFASSTDPKPSIFVLDGGYAEALGLRRGLGLSGLGLGLSLFTPFRLRVMRCAVLCCAVLCCAVLCVPNCAVLSRTMPYHAIQLQRTAPPPHHTPWQVRCRAWGGVTTR